ncbi:unnamed protein product [Schistosoma curassoni]|uniref:REJ domain-containing protein n=1 Tax=Schistosoma curassoni TaxID=6186 RepID=A0A183K7T3_9TREM|nr:unnamed protein product [Schistosoma curassoni]
MVVGGSQQETLDPGYVLLGTRQQGVPVILRELVISGGFDPVSPSFTLSSIVNCDTFFTLMDFYFTISLSSKSVSSSESSTSSLSLPPSSSESSSSTSLSSSKSSSSSTTTTSSSSKSLSSTTS